METDSLNFPRHRTISYKCTTPSGDNVTFNVVFAILDFYQVKYW